MGTDGKETMYGDLARWWPLISPPSEYVEEAVDLLPELMSATETPPVTLLELGSGGGSLAYHLKAHLRLTLSDLSPQMLEVSRAINPECEHIQGDMRSLRLGRQFDVVFIHGAIVYLTTENDLRAAIATAFSHCRPGGIAVFQPDYILETFQASTSHVGHDGAGRSLRYLEWVRTQTPIDNHYLTEYVLLLHEEGKPVEVVHDTHEEGVFDRATWLRLLREAGFEPVERSVRSYYGEEERDQAIFVARKSGES